MPSPFPGMDPYLEGHLWPDVHGTLIHAFRAALVRKLPPGYFAAVDTYVWLTEEDEEGDERPTRGGKPDVFVSGNGHAGVAAVCSDPTARVALAPPSPRPHRSIHLTEAEGGRLLTVIELLSPAEKAAGKRDRRNYLAKRGEYLAAGVNLLEIDLLRRGQRVPLDGADPPDGDYLVSLIRSADPTVADLWSFTVRERMPVVPVPLSDGVPDVPLDLRDSLDRAFDDAGYGEKLDYSRPPLHPLRRPDAEWAAERLAGRAGGA